MKESTMRTFTMSRLADESGVSGTGKVLESVIFSSGQLAAHWLGKRQSIVLFDSLEDFIAVHVTSHPSNGSRITYSDGEVLDFPITKRTN